MTAHALISASPLERWQRVIGLLRIAAEHGEEARLAPSRRGRAAAAGRRRAAIDAIISELEVLARCGVLAFVGHIIWTNWGRRSVDGDL